MRKGAKSNKISRSVGRRNFRPLETEREKIQLLRLYACVYGLVTLYPPVIGKGVCYITRACMIYVEKLLACQESDDGRD